MSTVDLLACDICHHLEPLCKDCQGHQAFRVDEPGAVCYECGNACDLGTWISPPLLDPNGEYESHYYHLTCLPKGCIAVE